MLLLPEETVNTSFAQGVSAVESAWRPSATRKAEAKKSIRPAKSPSLALLASAHSPDGLFFRSLYPHHDAR
jgi:hypothetical protein